jgi:Fe2+ or Zn2+ uptake regulation protein
VVEYQSEALEALQREIAARYEFELDNHTLELRGRCKTCRRSQRPSSPQEAHPHPRHAI